MVYLPVATGGLFQCALKNAMIKVAPASQKHSDNVWAKVNMLRSIKKSVVIMEPKQIKHAKQIYPHPYKAASTMPPRDLAGLKKTVAVATR